MDQIALPENFWRMMPHTYAEKMSGGKWKAYDYLHLIGREVYGAVFGPLTDDKKGGRLIVSAPPRHGKSLMISKWTPIWYLDMLPHRNVILTSYEADFAAKWGRDVRNEIQSNADIKVAIRQDSSAADRWETPEGGGMVTAGVGGAITGRGGNLIIVDDPVKNWEQATSATYREKVKNWFLSTLYTRCEPGATIVILMTRWHEDDLAGWLLREHEDAWKEIWLPAVSEPGDSLTSRTPGEALCPERYNEMALVGPDGKTGIMGSQGPIIWNSLYRQRPSSADGDIIKRSYFKYYQNVPANLTYAMSWDFAFGDTQGSSFVVGQVWGYRGSERYLIDQVRKRMDFVEMIEQMALLAVKWKQARLKIVENKANGPAIISQVKSKIAGIVKYNPKGSKEARLISVSPFFAAGNIFVPDPTLPGNVWVKDYIEEMVNMPNSPNDDQADATSQMLDYLATKAPTVGAGSITRKSPIPR